MSFTAAKSGHCENLSHPDGSMEIGDSKYHNMCKYTTETACELNPECKWHGIHKHVATESGHCEDVYHPEVSLEFGDLKYHSICKYATETSCEKDPKCKWHGIHKHVAAESGHCENLNHPAWSMEIRDSKYHNMCKHATETSCEKDPECKWHGIHKHVAAESGHCEDVSHPEGSNERSHGKYHELCRYHTETTCEKDSSCKWHGEHIPGRHINAGKLGRFKNIRLKCFLHRIL